MANSLFPAFFRLFSQSEFAPHVSTIPTREWTPGVGSNGTFENWISGNVDAGTMISSFVDLLLPFYSGATEFLYAIIYTMDSPTDPPRPRITLPFTGKIGTSASAATPASMGQYVFRTDSFGLLKLVFLDAPVTSNFLPIASIAPGSELEDLFDFIKADTNAIAGRDNGRVNAFVHATFKLNDELRKQYRLN